MSIEPFLGGQVFQAASLGQVTVVSWNDRDLQLQTTERYQPGDLIDSDVVSARFEAGNRGLAGARPLSELTLGQARTLARLPDQLTTVTHYPRI